MYGEQTGYAKVYPRKLTRQARSLDSILDTKPPQARSAGGERDLVKSWEMLYKRKQWQASAETALRTRSGGERPRQLAARPRARSSLKFRSIILGYPGLIQE